MASAQMLHTDVAHSALCYWTNWGMEVCNSSVEVADSPYLCLPYIAYCMEPLQPALWHFTYAHICLALSSQKNLNAFFACSMGGSWYCSSWAPLDSCKHDFAAELNRRTLLCITLLLLLCITLRYFALEGKQILCHYGGCAKVILDRNRPETLLQQISQFMKVDHQPIASDLQKAVEDIMSTTPTKFDVRKVIWCLYGPGHCAMLHKCCRHNSFHSHLGGKRTSHEEIKEYLLFDP